MMSDMTRGLFVWVGASIMVAAAVGMAAYWGRVGFRLDDTLGWVGATVGVAGLALAVFGAVASRRSDHQADRDGSSSRRPTEADVQLKAKASGHSIVKQAGRDLNEK